MSRRGGWSGDRIVPGGSLESRGRSMQSSASRARSPWVTTHDRGPRSSDPATRTIQAARIGPGTTISRCQSGRIARGCR